MAVVKLETPPLGVFRWVLRKQLDGVFYRFLYRWNLRAGAWYLDIGNDSGQAQVRGVKVCLGADKLRAYKYRDVPQGDLRVIDSTGTGTEPTWRDLGERVVIEYVEPDTVETFPEPDYYEPPE